MDCISVINLEKYQPHYKDGRKLIWVRWDIDAMHDYKIIKLSPTGKWLFVGLVCLGCKHNNLIPLDYTWLSVEIGIEKKRIPLEIKHLHELELIVTKCNIMLQAYTVDVTKCDLQTDRQTLHNNTDNTDIEDFFSYYKEKIKKNVRLTDEKIRLIKAKLSEGYSIEQLKQAVDNFIQDDWVGRKDNLDLIYCIGKQKDKADNLEKWINYVPSKKLSSLTPEEWLTKR